MHLSKLKARPLLHLSSLQQIPIVLLVTNMRSADVAPPVLEHYRPHFHRTIYVNPDGGCAGSPLKRPPCYECEGISSLNTVTTPLCMSAPCVYHCCLNPTSAFQMANLKESLFSTRTSGSHLSPFLLFATSPIFTLRDTGYTTPTPSSPRPNSILTELSTHLNHHSNRGGIGT